MSYEALPGNELAAVVTYLEMRERPEIAPPSSTLDLLRLTNPTAERYQHLTHSEVIEKRLRVMDLTAVLLAQEYSLPMRVFNMNRNGALQRIMLGDAIGTLIDNGYE